MITLQEINISHLGKRKIIFKMPFFRGYASSQEGILHPTVIFEKDFSTWALLILMKLRASRNTAGQPNVSWHLHGVQCYAFEAP